MKNKSEIRIKKNNNNILIKIHLKAENQHQKKTD